MQISLFDGDKKFKIDKPIRLIELFAGYGSQHFALEYLGVNFESWKICEWAVKSIQAYKDAHFSNDNTNYSNTLAKEQVFEYLANKGISSNYNEPMTYSQIKRLGEERARQIYNNIVATHNLVNIQQVKGKDLQVVDADKYCYIMTYSFPCQDLSSAGLGAGMAKGAGTRSGMLWEVERILDELKEENRELPQVLVMENVPEVIGINNIKHFAKWIEKLEQLGYKNKWQVLNAKDYGVPQNRERCFMISLLGDYYYDFPKTKKLELRLKDLLEDEVDEKFYLSDKMKEYIKANNGKWTGNDKKSVINRNIGVAINTRVGNTRADCSDYICDELPENCNLKTILCNKLVQSGIMKENYVINHSYTNGLNGKNPNSRQTLEDYIETTNNIMPTLTTRPDVLGVVVDDKPYRSIKSKNKRLHNLVEKMDLTKDNQFLDTYNQTTNENAGTITTRVDASNSNYVYTNLRIRKLTPKECFRLMGVKDQDFERIAQNQSNASLYHLAGDSIVVDVLMAIFKDIL